MLSRISIIAISLAIGFAGCQTVSYPDTQIALLSGNVAASQDVIADTIAIQLDRPSVTLSRTAFTKSHKLIIERASAGPIADGRRMDRPDHFELRTRSGVCFLFHEESQSLTKLEGVRCAIGVERPAP